MHKFLCVVVLGVRSFLESTFDDLYIILSLPKHGENNRSRQKTNRAH